MGLGITGQDFKALFSMCLNLQLLFYVPTSACDTETSFIMYIYVYISIYSSVFTQQQADFLCCKSSKQIPTAALQLRSQRRWERNVSFSKNKCSGRLAIKSLLPFIASSKSCAIGCGMLHPQEDHCIPCPLWSPVLLRGSAGHIFGVKRGTRLYPCVFLLQFGARLRDQEC